MVSCSNFKSDLHTHTTFSDGDFTPTQIVSIAAEKGYSQLSITDHDTLAGVNEGVEAGRCFGVSVIPGIEISLRFNRPGFTGSLHLLVYFSEVLLASKSFTDKLCSIVAQGRGEHLVRARVTRINQEFGPASSQPVLARELTAKSILSTSENVSRRHFARVLQWEYGLSQSETSLLIGNSSPAYLPSGVDMALLKPFFNEYPVIPVLAHPAAGSFPGDSHYKEVLPRFSTVIGLLPEFLDLGIKGIEVFYPGHTSAHIDSLLVLAKRHKLIVTGGSDCHDSVHRPIGVAGLDSPVNLFQEHSALSN